MNKKRIFRWLKIIVILYSSLGIAFYYLQNKILLHPTTLQSNYSFSFKRNFKELNIPINATSAINVVQFMPDAGKAKAVVLYFHGNRDNVERYEKFIDPFLKNNAAVWVVDYPGFGKSTGEFTEEAIYKMGYEVQKLAATSYAEDSIIVYGKSLGTGVAAYVASETKNKMLILETPYYSFRDAVSKYMFMYPLKSMMKLQFPTYKFLDGLEEPITILHGTDDGVVRYSSSEKLKPFLKPADVFYTLPGASHNTVNTDSTYFKVIDSLLQ